MVTSASSVSLKAPGGIGLSIKCHWYPIQHLYPKGYGPHSIDDVSSHLSHLSRDGGEEGNGGGPFPATHPSLYPPYYLRPLD